MHRVTIVAAVLLVLAGCQTKEPTTETTSTPATRSETTATTTTTASTATQPAATVASIMTRNNKEYGDYLTEGAGISMYIFMNDNPGQPSQCYDKCAEAWPPLLTSGQPTAGAPSVDASKLGTVERRDGTKQVTYHGWPLYYWLDDKLPGETKGQNVHGFFLISPAGNKIEATGAGKKS